MKIVLSLIVLAVMQTGLTAQTTEISQPTSVKQTTSSADEANEGHSGESAAQSPSTVTLTEFQQLSDHVNKQVVVEMDVRSTKRLDGKMIVFLNSKENYRDPDNMTVVIKSDSLEAFAEAEIPQPEESYLNKRIRIRGTVTLHRDRPQISVTEAKQITVLAELPTDPVQDPAESSAIDASDAGTPVAPSPASSSTSSSAPVSAPTP